TGEQRREARIASERRQIRVAQEFVGYCEATLDRVAQAGESLVDVTQPRLRARQIVGEEHARGERPRLLVRRHRALIVPEQNRGEPYPVPRLSRVLLGSERPLELELRRLPTTKLQQFLSRLEVVTQRRTAGGLGQRRKDEPPPPVQRRR